MTSMAKDAGEEGVHAAKRVIRRVRRSAEALQEAKEDAAYFVRHRPFKAVGIAAGVGLLIGVALGWRGSRFGSRQTGTRSSE